MLKPFPFAALLVLCLPAVFCASGNGNGSESSALLKDPQVTTVRYEAEDAELCDGAEAENSQTGYSGSGYVNQKGGDIFFRVEVPEEGYYKLTIRYWTGGLKKESLIEVNGMRSSYLVFDPADEWADLSWGRIKLKKGVNRIDIIKAWGWMNYDYIEISTAESAIAFDIAEKPVHPAPSPEAAAVYGFLKETFGQKTISGAMANYSTGLEEVTWIREKSGEWPALVGFDMIDYTRNYPFTDKGELARNAADYWRNNGLVSIMWHWRDPLRHTEQFYTESTAFDISKIDDHLSPEYLAMVSDIDEIAEYLKQLRDIGIPVLWRPLHEASGGWFWWGAKGADPCKKLWRLIYERLTEVHGLNNLIWVWTTDASGEAMEWYPGNECVDIVGMDIYSGERQHGSQYIAFNRVAELFGGEKILALSECGSIPTPELMFEYGDTWSWFMPWNGPMTRDDRYNGEEFIKEVMNSKKVITRSDMPRLR